MKSDYHFNWMCGKWARYYGLDGVSFLRLAGGRHQRVRISVGNSPHKLGVSRDMYDYMKRRYGKGAL
jgi:hypothetical protein